MWVDLWDRRQVDKRDLMKDAKKVVKKDSSKVGWKDVPWARRRAAGWDALRVVLSAESSVSSTVKMTAVQPVGWKAVKRDSSRVEWWEDDSANWKATMMEYRWVPIVVARLVGPRTA